MSGFVAVHLGAGHHSTDLEKEYQELCSTACRKASAILNRDGNAMDAVEAAVIELENSGLTNAGYGSNLTWDGTVECDASIMNGTTLYFGACGAVSRVRNPISLAKNICAKQAETLHLGRVVPCVLTGDGATEWARRVGLATLDNTEGMISSNSRRRFKRYKSKLKRYCDNYGVNYGPLDTVGAVCMDSWGTVAAGASSGGVSLKHPGRVGQAASFASGVWAAAGDAGRSVPSVAVCTSGCGEHLMRTQFAKCSAQSLVEDFPTVSLSECFKKGFCESPMLWSVGEKLAGMIGIRHDGDRGEILWGHTTPSMCLGYMASRDSHPKFVMSQLPSTVRSGTSSIVGGAPFAVSIKKPSIIKWKVSTADEITPRNDQ